MKSSPNSEVYFHAVPWRVLQQLCKRNDIRANMTKLWPKFLPFFRKSRGWRQYLTSTISPSYRCGLIQCTLCQVKIAPLGLVIEQRCMEMKTQWPKLSRWWQSIIWKNVKSFFTSLPFNKISSNIKNLGVSFGKSNTDMMHSVVSIKNIEIDR